MVFVVEESSKKILFRVDAWEKNSVATARKWVKDNGYTSLGDEITMNGDMVIWVK